MSEMIRVLIVDDHAVVRTGLRKVLESEEGIEVVGEAGDARNAVFKTRETKPDVILMDVVMPGKTGIEAIPDVLHDAPEAKVLILSMQDDPHYVREAFDAGASGYVLKEAVDTDVVAAIRDVAAGGRYVHPALGARMLAADAEERKRAEHDPLSDRERDVLRLLALGHTNQEIAGSSTSRCARPRRTVRTSCRSSGSAPARSSSATRSNRDCSRRRTSSRPIVLGADDQDRPLRLAEDAAGDAAEERSGDRAVTARADHDQVDVVGVGEGDDLVDGVAAQQRRRRDDPLLGRHLGGLDEQHPVEHAGLVREGTADAEPVRRHDVDHGHDVDEQELGRVLGGELDAEDDRLRCRRRAVCGNQDPLHLSPSFACSPRSSSQPAALTSVRSPIARA